MCYLWEFSSHITHRTSHITTMKFYSTKHTAPATDLKEAVIRGLPADNGLYMPELIRPMEDGFFEAAKDMSFPEMAFQLANRLLEGTIESAALKEIVYDAVNFEAPVHFLDEDYACLELFHGPSFAFKDFGARFMARIMSHFVKGSTEKLYILVATSGDTGGAVAQGFLGTPGIEVIILYPSQKISELQEKQLTTLGQNITALEVKGTFDDCQALVKQAFLDEELRAQLRISSANSINIARLIPQAFYYLYAWTQAAKKGKDVVFCVPSGNFGNITAGLIAHKMGLPVKHFVAANNSNDVFTKYHQTNIFEARPSVKTLSNAMDVGNPSNLQRIQDLYQNDIEQIRTHMSAYSFNDEQTKEAMKELYNKYQYLACPHTAVGYLGMKSYFEEHGKGATGVFLGTAHPAKFLDIVEPTLDVKVDIPARLQVLMAREKEAELMPTDYETFRAYLMKLV